MASAKPRKTSDLPRRRSARRDGEPAATGCSKVDALKAFVAQAPNAVAMTDTKLRFLKASPIWLADFGMAEHELLGRSSYDMAPETRRKYAALHKKCLAGALVSSRPERVVMPIGEERWMMWDAGPWRDEDGKVGGLLITSRDVTAEKELEEELRRTRSFLTNILDNVPAPLVVKDADGRVTIMNRAMEELHSASREDFVGRPLGEIIGRKAMKAVALEDQEVLATGGPLVVESMQTLTRDRGVRDLRKTKVVFNDDNGSPYILSISEDITERRKTQLELENTRAFLTTLVENVPIPLTVKDSAEGRIVLMNRANEILLGIPRDEIVGRTAHELFRREEADKLIQEDRIAVASGELQVSEDLTITTPGNGVRSVRQMKIAIRAPDGSPYLLTISEDITDSKKTQENLVRTQGFLTTIIDNMPTGLTVKDAKDGRLLMLNPAVEEMYGVEHGANVGKTGHDIFPAAQADRFSDTDREVIESGEMKIVEAEPTWTNNGVRFIRKKKIVVQGADGPDYLLSISEDVTERKRAEDALKDALAQAEAANVAKSEFLANMSHEIRTPLNGVLELADALSHMQLDDAQRGIVRMILDSGKALTGILSDVLDLAKAEAGQLELRIDSFDLRETVGQAAFLFETVARSKGVDFQVAFDAGAPDRLMGDPLRIRQIVSNLISNAVKFTSEGRVSVRVETTPDSAGGAKLKVTVDDTGPGFSEEVRDKLFSRFEQGDGSVTRRFGGTGLGLSIANALAHMMGGEISCSAIPGEGASFVFCARFEIDRTAPARLSKGDAGRDAALAIASDKAKLGRPLRLLLAEDHLINQRVVELMLGEIAELTIVGDGDAAVAAFDGDGPFDLILMDTQMPLMDGLTAIRRIREAEVRLGRPRTPIISLTANAMDHQVKAGRDAGADGHLCKPITSEGLFTAIHNTLEGTAGRATTSGWPKAATSGRRRAAIVQP